MWMKCDARIKHDGCVVTMTSVLLCCDQPLHLCPLKVWNNFRKPDISHEVSNCFPKTNAWLGDKNIMSWYKPILLLGNRPQKSKIVEQ